MTCHNKSLMHCTYEKDLASEDFLLVFAPSRCALNGATDATTSIREAEDLIAIDPSWIPNDVQSIYHSARVVLIRRSPPYRYGLNRVARVLFQSNSQQTLCSYPSMPLILPVARSNGLPIEASEATDHIWKYLELAVCGAQRSAIRGLSSP